MGKKTKKRGKKEMKTPIVGIGASAGGLEALEIFFTHLSLDANVSFVIIQHLSPKYKSIMGSILEKFTSMQVFTIEDGIEVRPNCIYLNPPHRSVALNNGKLYLLEPKEGEIHLPIDHFFRSLSKSLKEKAIAIVLSGSATDGTLGIRAVKESGGVVIVQDPNLAKYPGMPQSAVSTGLVDYVLPVEGIPDKLQKYLQHPYLEAPIEKQADQKLIDKHLDKIFFLVESKTGHDFSHYKKNTIHRRIHRRMALRQIVKMEDYIRYLEKNPPEVDALFKDFIIGVTSFFRDPKAFQALKERAICSLVKNKDKKSKLRVWIPGCSTGEEAYSILILFVEAMEKYNKHVDFQIFASDIDGEAIHTARTAVYPDSIAAHVSAKRLTQFFIPQDNSYRLKKQYREMVIFVVQNITKDPPFSRIDLVSCRNMMIYMDSSLQKKLLPLFHYILNENGILFLGTSESISEFSQLFAPLDNRWKIFARKSIASDKVRHPIVPFYQSISLLDEKKQREIPESQDVHALFHKEVMDRYTLPCVLINDKYEVVNSMGDINKFLKVPSGKANWSILNMVRKELRYKLLACLQDVVKQKKTVLCRAVHKGEDGQNRIIDIEVHPLVDQTFLLVVFCDRTPIEIQIKEGKKILGDHVDPLVVSLEEELQSTKEYLQTTIEELEASNEELKSANEELQALNEELQSTNEELETSKEELQSTNEELVTVNTEQQKKVDELSEANDDIVNLLANTEIGTIFLDSNLCIKRFTPAITEIFNVIPSDLGRPISDITSSIPYDNLYRDAQQVLRTLTRQEVEIESKDGDWYSIRTVPYRTIDNLINGLVVTFIKITTLKRTQEKLRHLQSVLANIDGEAIVSQDFNGKILGWNTCASKIYGWSKEEALHSMVWRMIPEEKHQETRDYIAQLEQGESIEPFATQRVGKDGQIFTVLLSAIVLLDVHGKPSGFITLERRIDSERNEHLAGE